MPVAEFPGHARLGLRRHLHLSGAVVLRRPARPQRGSSTPRTTPASPSSSTSSTTTSAPPGTQALEAFGPYFTAQVRDALGEGDQLRRRATATRFANGCSRAPPAGSRDFGIDGLRLDAIHAIFDSSAEHIVAAVARRVHAHARRCARDRRERPQRPARDARPATVGGWGCDAAVGRRLPPLAARAPHRRARRATTPTSARSPSWPRPGTARSSTTGTTRLPPAALRRPGRRRARPSDSSSSTRTTTRSATAPSATGCRHRRARWPPSARCCPRSCRCCSWARSTARTAPFQFFTDHIDESIADATREGRRAEFAAFAAFASRRSPTRRTPRRSSAPKLTRGARSGAVARSTRSCWRCAAASRPATPTRSSSTRTSAGCGSDVAGSS